MKEGRDINLLKENEHLKGKMFGSHISGRSNFRNLLKFFLSENILNKKNAAHII